MYSRVQKHCLKNSLQGDINDASGEIEEMFLSEYPSGLQSKGKSKLSGDVVGQLNMILCERGI